MDTDSSDEITKTLQAASDVSRRLCRLVVISALQPVVLVGINLAASLVTETSNIQTLLVIGAGLGFLGLAGLIFVESRPIHDIVMRVGRWHAVVRQEQYDMSPDTTNTAVMLEALAGESLERLKRQFGR